MLIWLLLQIPLTIINSFASWIPKVTVLPLGLDAILISGVGYLFYLFAFFPPLQLLYDAFLVIIVFKIGLRVFLMIPVLGKMLHR